MNTEKSELKAEGNGVLADVKISILARIKDHETTIKDTIKFIGKDLNEDTLKRMTPLIESEEIRISELKAVLKYCF